MDLHRVEPHQVFAALTVRGLATEEIAGVSRAEVVDGAARLFTEFVRTERGRF